MLIKFNQSVVSGIVAASAITLGALTASSQATLDIQAASNKTLALLTSSAAGSVSGGGIEGNGIVTLALLTSNAQASLNIAATTLRTLQLLTTISAGFNDTPIVAPSGIANIYQQQYRRRLR